MKRFAPLLLAALLATAAPSSADAGPYDEAFRKFLETKVRPAAAAAGFAPMCSRPPSPA